MTSERARHGRRREGPEFAATPGAGVSGGAAASGRSDLERQRVWSRCVLPLAGLLALGWFLLRAIPKPSRASYPCQRAAFPLASSFVVWLIGSTVSATAFHKAKSSLARSRYLTAAMLAAVVVGAAFVAIDKVDTTAAAAVRAPNEPLGVARGVHPGRVVWVHDPDATDWNGPDAGDGHWWESGNTNQAAVDQMMSRSIRLLAGAGDGAEAWSQIFRYFNRTHGRGDVGYQPGEKIVIKVNFVGFIGVWGGAGVDPATYDLVQMMDYMNTSPQMMLALLRQLVYGVGVAQSAISIGDPLCYFPNQYYNVLHGEFPNVRYLDYEGRFGRSAVQRSSIPVYWSSRPSASRQDYVPDAFAQATYVISMANLKSHTEAGVTLSGKNNFGSLVRWPEQSGYHDLHDDLPAYTAGMGHYRNLVDLLGHAHLGGKTLLFFIDGLYAGEHPTDNFPKRMTMAPFFGDWSSSLFVSQDPVAIDSVAFDILSTEASTPGTAWSGVVNALSGAEDYLHEAALANNPPSGVFYDPDHSSSVHRLASLGAHEHWNNSNARQYSRNLGTGDGIELVYYGAAEVSGSSGFFNLMDKTEYSWPAQGNATSYEVARATSPDFSLGCYKPTPPPTVTYWRDPQAPSAGGCFCYLVRVLTPRPGSWGQDSRGIERTNICP